MLGLGLVNKQSASPVVAKDFRPTKTNLQGDGGPAIGRPKDLNSTGGIGDQIIYLPLNPNLET